MYNWGMVVIRGGGVGGVGLCFLQLVSPSPGEIGLLQLTWPFHSIIYASYNTTVCGGFFFAMLMIFFLFCHTLISLLHLVSNPDLTVKLLFECLLLRNKIRISFFLQVLEFLSITNLFFFFLYIIKLLLFIFPTLLFLLLFSYILLRTVVALSVQSSLA